MDLVEEIASRAAWAPKVLCTADVSAASLAVVPVPWALTCSIASGGSDASASAAAMARTMPSGSGAVRSPASALMPKPTISPRISTPRVAA